jgi:subtilisin family serine protease
MMVKTRIVCQGLLILCVAATAIVVASGSSAASSKEGPYVPLRLAWGTFDPLREPPERLLPVDLKFSAAYSDGPGYYLIQFRGPIHESDKEAVTALGVELFDYVPDFGFVARMNAATANAVESLDIVRWIGVYQPAYRIEPGLTAQYVGFELDASLELLVITFKGEDVANIASQLEGLGGTVLEVTQSRWKGKIRVQINSDRLTDVASIPGVSWVEAMPEWRLFNNIASDVIGVRPVWNTHGLYGTGQIVAVCDTGLDQGSTTPSNLHDDFQDGSGGSRVVSLYDLVGDGASDVNSGHGTHVVGSVLGNGDLSGATPSSHNYPNTAYVGMAPEASLVFQAVENNATESLTGIPADLNTLFLQAYNDGARVHSNSWGSDTLGAYDSYSRDVDEFTWDNPFMLILFAASNDGIDENSDGVIDLISTTPPGTAKNCVTVGATENNRPSVSYTWGGSWPMDFPANPINSDQMADDPEGLAAFSSRGPTLDGRTKPDVVAPGTFVASVRSASCQPDCTGWGVIDVNYMYMGGTSMATPLVAGTGTVAREYFVSEETYAPTGALLKATLANGATDIYPGQYGTGGAQEVATTRPSQQAGWGRVDLEDSLFPSGTRETWYWDTSAVITSSLNSLSTGETATYTLEVTASDPLSVTLAWTDYPGTPAAAGGLVNDLDLKVEGPGGMTYYPNNAGQRGSTEHLFYDDWDYNGSWTWSAGIRNAVCFTPSSYPATVDMGLFNLASSSYPKTFNYHIYTGSCSTGPSGAPVASGSTTIRRAGWHPVDLSGHGVILNSGDEFFLAIELPDSELAWFYDNTAPIDGRSWDYSSGSWSNWMSDDYMFHATVKSADYGSTSYDRVNNLVGIDVASPATGVYTITIDGYNVPRGPQNYALVVSGVGRLLGEETVTRTISSIGTYKFGNTGVTIEFTSEDLDAVAVTVYRDQYHSSGSNGVKRYYSITPIGGTGAFNANVVFSYEQAEFDASGITDESTLQAWRWSGGSWESVTGTVDIASNVVTVTGVTAFSDWTLSDQNPTAVALSSFTAEWDGGEVLVVWETALEIDTVGFNLWRSTAPDGEYERVNAALIPAASPGGAWGGFYSCADVDATPGATYYYKLEELEVGGARNWYGPVSTGTEAPNAITILSFAAENPSSLVLVWRLTAAALVVGASGTLLVRRKNRP